MPWRYTKRTAALAAAALVAVLTPRAAVAQQSSHFMPDWTFEGSDLSAFKTIGQTDWSADDGVITGTPRGQGGWLVIDRSYQDAQFYTRFRCTDACEAGVMFRMEARPGGGYEGVFVSLGDSLRLYRLTLDENGREVSRNPLRAAPAMMRIAPPPDEDGRERMAPPVFIDADDWNELTVVIDANIIGPHVNGWRFGGAGTTDDGSRGYGPIALFVGGSGAVQFEDVSTKDYNERTIPREQTSNRFTMQQLDEFYYAWDTAIADIDRDGELDVVAGPYVHLGPDYTTRREIYLGETYNPSTEYTDNMITHAADFTGDGWPDVLATEMRPMVLYVNPQGENRRWARFEVLPGVITESTIPLDMDGDGNLEIVYGLGEGTLAYAEPDPANPTAPWTVHQISDPMGFGRVIHGLGAGDVNGDGRPDILIPTGWFEQPAGSSSNGKWPFHPFPFNEAGGIEGPGGANMSVVDLNGDGLNDVVTSLDAHGWGLAWFEQKRDAAGEITFEPHLIMGDLTTENAGDTAFSQLHSGVETADVDGDGVADLITGKRYWAHLDSSTDPDPYGEAVLYWYRTVENPEAQGGLSFEPELIHNRSGVGSQFEVEDLNGDGAVDIITSGDRGTFIFWGSVR